jgi:hypothetical protein
MSRARRRRMLRRAWVLGVQLAAVGLCVVWVWGSFRVARMAFDMVGPQHRIVSAENGR